MAKPASPGNCVACNREIHWLDDNPRSTNLRDAIDLTGTAAYGSGWDGVPHLIVYLCDDCVRDRGITGAVHQLGDDGKIHVWSPANADEHADFSLF